MPGTAVYELRFTRITNTCRSLLCAKYSTVVSVSYGVMMRLIVGPFSTLRNSVVLCIALLSLKSESQGILELEEAWRVTWAASYVLGRPVTENMEIFLPRAMDFMV